jgi:hypothetical protein
MTKSVMVGRESDMQECPPQGLGEVRYVRLGEVRYALIVRHVLRVVEIVIARL